MVTRLVLEKETGVEEEVLEMGGGIFLSIDIIIFHSSLLLHIIIIITIAKGARAGGGRPERCGRHIGGGGGRGQFPSGQKDN